ncbi:MAG: type II toxin-antitoxin system RelE/ParE family toxin [Acidobacteria bacterium]|nr:type II toxin-antitoxin system RelE/ParE family toxin [Acidobacteriota bacterium]MBI4444133.1 type II toxin-antitoxin system RelE/ParE family toxin [Acidobacteriota bacterium]
MTPVLRPAATADIEEAFLWYERQRPGLGEEFLAAVQSALDDIVTYPTRYPVIHRNTRRALLWRFPYAIFCRAYEEVVVVVACMHGRRNPIRWRSRRWVVRDDIVPSSVWLKPKVRNNSSNGAIRCSGRSRKRQREMIPTLQFCQ